LVDAATGFHLWSETFDRPEADVFAVQAEISESVAVALSITLGVGELGNAPGGTASFEAFELTLKARERFQAFTPESVMEAIRLLQRALEIDPDYATAWVKMAVYCNLGRLAFSEPPAVDWLDRSREALDQARRLSPDMPALLPATMDLHHARGEWGEIERAMVDAGESEVALLPGAHFSYGVFLAKMGRVRDALAHLHHARQLEPLAPWYGSKLGHVYLLNGRVGEALAEHERVWALGYGNRFFQSTDGLLASLEDGDLKLIDQWLTRVIEHTSGSRAEFYEAIRQRLDDSTEALSWLRAALHAGASPAGNYWVAVFAAWFGDPALAADALQQSPDAYAIWIPFMADLRRQPEFEGIVRQLGLPEYWREFAWADSCRPVNTEEFVCE